MTPAANNVTTQPSSWALAAAESSLWPWKAVCNCGLTASTVSNSTNAAAPSAKRRRNGCTVEELEDKVLTKRGVKNEIRPEGSSAATLQERDDQQQRERQAEQRRREGVG